MSVISAPYNKNNNFSLIYKAKIPTRDRIYETSQIICLYIQDFFYSLGTGLISIIAPKYLFQLSKSAKIADEEYVKKIDARLSQRRNLNLSLMYKDYSFSLYLVTLGIFDAMFRGKVYNKHWEEYEKNQKMCREKISQTYFDFPFEFKKQFNAIYDSYKNILKKFDLDPKGIYLFIDAKGIDAISRGGIPKISNSCVAINPYAFHTAEETKAVMAHEIAHISQCHTIKILAITIIIYISWIFILILNVYVQWLFSIFTLLSLKQLSIYQEKEADLLSAKKAGPDGLISFFKRLIAFNIDLRNKILNDKNSSFFKKTYTKIKVSENGNYRFDFFHPGLTDRVKYLNNLKFSR